MRRRLDHRKEVFRGDIAIATPYIRNRAFDAAALARVTAACNSDELKGHPACGGGGGAKIKAD